jgi:hypothetical protein
MFSITVVANTAIRAAIAAIAEDAWVAVRYPGAVHDPDTGEWISDAEVAETVYTAFAGTRHQVTARLVVRRVKDKNPDDALFPVWRYHAFFTNTALSTVEADLTHRRHAIVETTFADLIDGPLAHLPSGHFDANAAWVVCAAIAHNLLRAAGSLTSIPRQSPRRDPAQTSRRRSRPPRPPPRTPGPAPSRALALGRGDHRAARGHRPTHRLTPPDHRPPGPTGDHNVDKLGRPADSTRPQPENQKPQATPSTQKINNRPIGGLRLSTGCPTPS